MALKLSQSPTFWWPVTVMVPVDGGRHDKQSFDIEFARLSVSESEKLVSGIVSGEISEFDGFRQMVKGWRGVVDDNGDVPFSETILRQLLEIPTMAIAIIQAYKDANSEVARRKN
jgi:hypothetical protein